MARHSRGARSATRACLQRRRRRAAPARPSPPSHPARRAARERRPSCGIPARVAHHTRAKIRGMLVVSILSKFGYLKALGPFSTRRIVVTFPWCFLVEQRGSINTRYSQFGTSRYSTGVEAGDRRRRRQTAGAATGESSRPRAPHPPAPCHVTDLPVKISRMAAREPCFNTIKH